MNVQAAAVNFDPHLHLPKAAFRAGRLSIFSEPILWAEPQKPETERQEEQAEKQFRILISKFFMLSPESLCVRRRPPKIPLKSIQGGLLIHSKTLRTFPLCSHKKKGWLLGLECAEIRRGRCTAHVICRGRFGRSGLGKNEGADCFLCRQQESDPRSNKKRGLNFH